MPIFIAILFAIPALIVDKLGWQFVMIIWALLFAGSAVIKLLSMAF